MNGPAPLLDVDGLVAGYGIVPALHGLSFSLEQGVCAAVLGPNGAGKSTLARTLTGVIAPMEGSISFDGAAIAGRAPHLIARRGLIRLPETRGIFPNLSVDENLTLGVGRAPTKTARREALERIRTEFPIFGQRGRQLAGTLSGGEQQILALCHVVAVPPLLLVADELSLGLAPVILDRIYELIDRIRGAGTTILLIEQFLDRALGCADRVIMLRRGHIVLDSPASQVREDDYFRQMMSTDV